MGTNDRGSWGYGYQRPERVMRLQAHSSRALGGGFVKRQVEFHMQPVRTLDDMGADEVRALELRYGMQVAGGRFQFNL